MSKKECLACGETWTKGECCPNGCDEWDEYEEAGPMDLEDQLERLLK
jgi:hypothetical protein